jgi:molybdopterin synthase sulfur carrier subunit
MRIDVLCFGAFKDYLPEEAEGNRWSAEVPGGSTVGDVVDALGAPRSLVFGVLLDGLQAPLDVEVHEGAEITLMPPYSGG